MEVKDDGGAGYRQLVLSLVNDVAHKLLVPPLATWCTPECNAESERRSF